MKTAPTEISIFADYGDAYAWNKGASTGLAYLFPENKKVEAVDVELQRWAGDFWKSFNRQDTFPWKEFHARGIKLATQFHEALPPEMDIEISYGRPTEDPQYKCGEKIIIRARRRPLAEAP